MKVLFMSSNATRHEARTVRARLIAASTLRTVGTLFRTEYALGTSTARSLAGCFCFKDLDRVRGGVHGL